MYNHVHDVKVYDSGINLSAHCPLILMVDVLLSLAPNVSCSSNTRSSSKSGDVLSFRWDKGDIYQYSMLTYNELSHVVSPTFAE